MSAFVANIAAYVSARRRAAAAVGLVAAAALAALAWWLGSPLFVDTEVNEAFPFEMPSQGEIAAMTDAQMRGLRADFDAAMPSADTVAALRPDIQRRTEERVMEVAAQLPPDVMDEAMPAAMASAEPETLASGEFQDADDFHRGSGAAAVLRGPDGAHVLRFEDFRVTNGPALSVLLSPSAAVARPDDLGNYLDLGPLKGNVGNQNYAIPAGTDVSQYRTVVIFCVPFRVVFSTAQLG